MDYISSTPTTYASTQRLALTDIHLGTLQQNADVERCTVMIS